MPARNDHATWHDVELADLRRLSEVEGVSAEHAARFLNEKYHKGKPVRTDAAVSNMRRKRRWKVARIPKAHRDVGPRKEQEVEREETLDGIVLRSRGSRIKTVAELLAHAHVTGEVTRQTVKTWDTTLVENGESKTVQNFAIHVEVRPNQTSTEDAVRAIIDGAFAKRAPLQRAMKNPRMPPSTGLMQAVVIADPHIAKHAWSKETGHGDYDIKIATETLREASAHLMMRGDQEGVRERHFYLLGDFFHYDTPGGATTKGTPLERDGRAPKMIREGAKALFDIIEASRVPTKVVLVGGNHDEILTHALQEILKAYFRNTSRVTIDDTHTVRRYVQWGKCLIGLTHGDKAKKLLPGLMAREASDLWSQSTLREWHRGHLHYRKDVDTLEGVLIRQHPALCPPDAWHAGEGFVSPRGMDAIIYHETGCVVAAHSYTPDVRL